MKLIEVPAYINFRNKYQNTIKVRYYFIGKIKTLYSPDGALARWEKIHIRCKKLEEDFYAARCLSLNCNLGEFDITKPLDVSVKTSPVFVVNHLEGMPVRAKVLVPVACYCKVVN